jgi:hypothetical protein
MQVYFKTYCNLLLLVIPVRYVFPLDSKHFLYAKSRVSSASWYLPLEWKPAVSNIHTKATPCRVVLLNKEEAFSRMFVVLWTLDIYLSSSLLFLLEFWLFAYPNIPHIHFGSSEAMGKKDFVLARALV